jgi:hypothetical protein
MALIDETPKAIRPLYWSLGATSAIAALVVGGHPSEEDQPRLPYPPVPSRSPDTTRQAFVDGHCLLAIEAAGFQCIE